MDTLYEAQHEQFVRSTNGTSAEYVMLLCAIGPICSVLIRILLTGINFSLIFQLGAEITILNVFPVLAYTIWNDYISVLLFCLTVICFGLLIIFNYSKDYTKQCNKINSNKENVSHSKSTSLLEFPVSSERLYLNVITEFRSHILLLTTVCILAVDFPIFPHHLAKTETYGWSLMDSGVGYFVFINSLFSGQARRKQYDNKLSCIYKVFKSCGPLLLLGIVRALIIKSTGYHQNVSEYGIHWNFFITLALTKVFCTVVLIFLPWCNSLLLSMLIIVFYQYMLTHHKQTDYLFNDQRDNIFHANKEGIYSLLGYISIYFAGVEFGRFFSKPRNTVKEWIYVFIFFCAISFISWAVMHLISNNIENVSRRTANLPYCLWMIWLNCSFNTLLLFENLILEIRKIQNQKIVPVTALKEEKQIILSNAISKFSLYYFLLANVLTGIINTCVKTIYASTTVSILIILGYMIILSLFVIFLYMYFSVPVKNKIA